MSFSTLGLSDPILQALDALAYAEPTSIQKQAIPVILAGEDVIATAQTGTGKTAAFVLPVLERFSNSPKQLRGKRIRMLILVPTRELAVQVEANIAAYSKHLNLSSMAVYGGVDTEPQKKRLIAGVDILVATPGRLLDLVYQRAVRFDELEVLVLDEADRMVDMGAVGDIDKILERLPTARQNLLFSATMSHSVRQLAERFTANTAEEAALEIAISPEVKAAPGINQWLIAVDLDTKSALLSHLIKAQEWDQALIFVEKKHSAARLVSQLEKRGISADAIHGDRSQAVRENILADFKSGKLKYLVATGVAARGIDIGKLSRVVNYDLPFKPEEYIHRIGRTGRAGEPGEAISLVAAGDFKKLCAIESRLNHLIDRKTVNDFPVRKEMPVSILNYVPKSKRKPTTKPSSKSRNRPAGKGMAQTSGDGKNKHIWDNSSIGKR